MSAELSPEQFPALFAEGWALPKPQPFLEHFMPLFHAEARFVQPFFPEAHGQAEIERLFRRLFIQLPGMTVAPRSWAVNGDTVFIESECSATLAGKPVGFDLCDRFTIVEGKVTERVSFSDSLPLLLSALRRPASWPGLLRSRFA